MLVIMQNTEQILLKELHSCWESFPTLRCMHLKFSRLPIEKEEWFSDVVDTLHHFLDDTTAQLYLCHDQDIFVICRTLTQKRVHTFLAQLSSKLAPASLEGLASLFEIGVDWPKLRELCEKKIENIRAANAASPDHKNDNTPKFSREDTINTLSHELISSLDSRRAHRDKPEILIVEDDPFSQRMVSNALKNKYKHSMTGDGQGAIMNYVNKAPDVLFLDIGLPDINGHEVLKKLFELDPHAYVVMFSGNGDKENIMRAIELGAKGFVGKPFTHEKLFQYIEKSPFIQAKHKKESLHGNLIH